MIPNDDVCTFYRIRERTRDELLAVGSDGNILRWGKTDGPEQEWLIVPVDDHRCRIVTRQNGEYMAVGSNGNVLRWGPVNDQTQVFSFVNETKDHWWNIQEFTKNEYVAVGSDGNVLRWGPTGGKEQQFRLEPVGARAKPRVRDGHYQSQQVPDIPRLEGFSKVPPERSPYYLIGEAVIPSTLVSDPGYAEIIRQVEDNPYYILVREQYWDRTSPRGFYREHDGRSTITDEVKIITGVSNKTSESIERTLGIKVTISGGLSWGKKGSLKAAVETSYRLKLTSTTQTETMQEETHVTKVTIDSGRRFAKAYWTLVDRYTLKTVDERVVETWEIVLKSTTIEDSFPALEADAAAKGKK